MELPDLVAVVVGLERGADPERRRTFAKRALVVGVADHHVATIASQALELTSGGRACGDRRDDLDELRADREDRVAQAEHRDARIVERNLQTEHSAEIGDDRVEVVSDECHLAEADHRNTGLRFSTKARNASAVSALAAISRCRPASYTVKSANVMRSAAR